MGQRVRRADPRGWYWKKYKKINKNREILVDKSRVTYYNQVIKIVFVK